MKRLFAIAATAGALAVAAPAFADTIYADPGTVQSYAVSSGPVYDNGVATGYNNRASYDSVSSVDNGPFGIIAAPFRMITAPFGATAQTANGAATGRLVPTSPGCYMQKDFNGKYTALCGP